ncbi:hypothetical protein CQW23_26018 [Capsicum baccatum]|uniref:Ubiquitin-like protease family profile domain-containing protein n=1 Tax=Capsicum baccatum TaxID=33114 RepID=A0A2G2VMM3_CAPBA|nr:hypothetical protein CQW23_26018 [Capsicum baccatum]
MTRVLPKLAPHIGCDTISDIEHHIKLTLTKNQYNSIFVVCRKKKSFVVQAQFGKCIMSFETKKSTTNVIVTHEKGINLQFSPREFDVVTSLNCVSNKDNFVFDEDLPNRLIEDYFGGAKYIQKRELFTTFSGNIWGKDNDEDAVKFANIYFIHAFLLSSIDTVVVPRLHFDLVDSGHYRSATSKKYSITQKKHHGDSSSSPINKKLKQQHRGLDEQTPRRTPPPPPRAVKKLSVRNPIFMLVQQKEKVSSKRKDINWLASKKSIPIQSHDLSLSSSGNKNDFVTKKVFHKFRNGVLQEMKSIRGLVSARCDEIMNAISEIKVTEEINGNQRASLIEMYNEDKDDVLDKTDIDQHEARDICESPNTKLIDDNIGEAHISNSQFPFPHENTGGAMETTVNTSAEDESKNNECDDEKILDTSEDYQVEINENKSPKDDSKKSKYDLNTSYKYNTIDCNFMNIINSVLAVYRIDDASLNASGKEYHLNKYINGFRMHTTMHWHTVDHIFISINAKAKHHWVLAVISFNDRYIYVYDSLSSTGHDPGVLAEVEKLAEVIPICLVACKFYEKKGIDTANHPNYKFYNKMDQFDVYVVEDLPQQPSGSF